MSASNSNNGLERACTLVQAILDQVTLGDSPPDNEEHREFVPGRDILVGGGGLDEALRGKQQQQRQQTGGRLSPPSLRRRRSTTPPSGSSPGRQKAASRLSPRSRRRASSATPPRGRAPSSPTSTSFGAGATVYGGPIRYSRQRHVLPPGSGAFAKATAMAPPDSRATNPPLRARQHRHPDPPAPATTVATLTTTTSMTSSPSHQGERGPLLAASSLASASSPIVSPPNLSDTPSSPPLSPGCVSTGTGSVGGVTITTINTPAAAAAAASAASMPTLTQQNDARRGDIPSPQPVNHAGTISVSAASRTRPPPFLLVSTTHGSSSGDDATSTIHDDGSILRPQQQRHNLAGDGTDTTVTEATTMDEGGGSSTTSQPLLVHAMAPPIPSPATAEIRFFPHGGPSPSSVAAVDGTFRDAPTTPNSTNHTALIQTDPTTGLLDLRRRTMGRPTLSSSSSPGDHPQPRPRHPIRSVGYNSRRVARSELTMGNVSLAALCARTLDSVAAVSSLPTHIASNPTLHDIHDENATVGETVSPSTVSILSTSPVANTLPDHEPDSLIPPAGGGNAVARYGRGGRWLGRRLKSFKNKPDSLPGTNGTPRDHGDADANHHARAEDDGDHAHAEDDDDGDSMAMTSPKPMPRLPSPRRAVNDKLEYEAFKEPDNKNENETIVDEQSKDRCDNLVCVDENGGVVNPCATSTNVGDMIKESIGALFRPEVETSASVSASAPPAVKKDDQGKRNADDNSLVDKATALPNPLERASSADEEEYLKKVNPHAVVEDETEEPAPDDELEADAAAAAAAIICPSTGIDIIEQDDDRGNRKMNTEKEASNESCQGWVSDELGRLFVGKGSSNEYPADERVYDDGDVHVADGGEGIVRAAQFLPSLQSARFPSIEEKSDLSSMASEPKLRLAKRASHPPIKKEGNDVSKYPIPGTVTKKRIQMFGSEYARYISSTPLSPPVPKVKGRLKRRERRGKLGSIVGTVGSTGTSITPSIGAGSDVNIVHTSSNLTSGTSATSSNPNINNLEDASESILTGAITDILVTHGSEAPPRGYFRISQTADGTDVNALRRVPSGGMASIVPGRKMTTVHLNVKKEPKWDRAVQRPCVTALAVIFPDRNEFVPPGFCVVRRYKSKGGSGSGNAKGHTSPSGTDGSATRPSSSGKSEGSSGGHGSKSERGSSVPVSPSSPGGGGGASGGGTASTIPANLNFGTSGERVYLCYRRSREGNPITGIIPLQPSNNEAIPEGYTVLERTPRNYVADLNSKAGPALFLAFRQRLANLEPLRPLPLVLSVYYSNLPDGEYDAADPVMGAANGRVRRLCAYYCTGGTVVPSEVGRFHIMDRSTHPLLSPSSVTNRLSLIQASRRQRSMGNVVPSSPASSTGGPPAPLSPDSVGTYPPQPGRKKNKPLGGVVGNVKIPSPTRLRNKEKGRRTRNNVSFSLSKGLGSTSENSLSLLDSSGKDPSLSEGISSEFALQQMSYGEADSVISRSSSDIFHQSHAGSGMSSSAGIRSLPHVNMAGSFESSPSLPMTASGGGTESPRTSSPSNLGLNRINELDGSEHSTYGEYDNNSHQQHHHGISRRDADSIFGDSSSDRQFPAQQSRVQNTSSGLFTHDDPILQSCFDAMEFIPTIECPATDNLPLMKDHSEKDTLILLQARVAVLSPILTACYTYHGGSALVAVEGLTGLLSDTDFFRPDLSDDPGDVVGSSTRLTLLDLAVQVVCDVATSSSRETNFGACVEFVADAVRFASGNLNTRTIGYVFRFYLFVFYFGASVPTSSSWPDTSDSQRVHTAGSGKESEPFDVALLDEETLESHEKKRTYFPGGAPQAAALALKEFFSLVLGRMIVSTPKSERRLRRSFSHSSIVSMMSDSNEGRDEAVEEFVQGLLHSIIDGAVNRVDIANFTQLALHQIHRSGGSELFWHDMMTSCGVGLFSQGDSIVSKDSHAYIIAFSVLASVVKVASGKVRRVAQTSELVPRDVASKLLSLELLLHFLRRWKDVVCAPVKDDHSSGTKLPAAKATMVDGMESPSVKTMAYTIRRLVIPCLLSNTMSGLENSRVFRRMIQIVTELWSSPHYRHHMKMELGVLIEHFVLKMLRLGPQVLPPKRLRDLGNRVNSSESSMLEDISSSLLPHQLSILTEVQRWFSSDPTDTLELFLNFDIGDAYVGQSHVRMLPSAYWKICQQLCGALCTLAEQCGEIIGEQIRATRFSSGVVGGGYGAAGNHHSSSLAVSHAVSHNHQAIAVRGEDLNEMKQVREGARLLQERSFEVISQIVKSLLECAAASFGGSYAMTLSATSVFGAESSITNSQSYAVSSAGGSARKQDSNVVVGGGNGVGALENKASADDADADADGYQSDSSVSSMGSAAPGTTTKNSKSTSLGGWKTSRRKIDTGTSVAHHSTSESSPRLRHLSPMRVTTPRPSSPRPPNSGDGGIVEYWQTSIAERRKGAASATSNLNVPETSSLSGDKSGKSHRRTRSKEDRPDFPPLSPSRENRPNLKYRAGPAVGTRNKTPSDHVSPIASPHRVGVTAKNFVSTSTVSNQQMEDTLKVALEIMATKSLKKALEYLFACNFLTPSPRDVASFLRIQQTQINPVVLGEYLGEGGKDGADVEYWNLIRFNYVRAISFVGMNVEQGLRHFLTNCGFRLPGEAQKIDRIISTFAQCYWEDNAGDNIRCPFHDQDTVFLISFAIIMLNTDLHSTSIQQSSGRKQRKKMTRTEFLNNLRGVDNSEDLSRDYLSAVYDSIEAHPIAIYHPMPTDDIRRGRQNKLHSSRHVGHNTLSDGDLNSMIKSLMRSVKPAQELLRGLAVHEHTFLNIEHYGDYDVKAGPFGTALVPKDLVRSAVNATWHHFHGIVNTTLDIAHLDPRGMEFCLDVLKYSLCTTIFLGMTMERSAFVTQLARVKFFKEGRKGAKGQSRYAQNSSQHLDSSGAVAGADGGEEDRYPICKDEEWYQELEHAYSDSNNEAGKIVAAEQVSTMINELRGVLQIDAKVKKEMTRVARRMRNGELLLNDPTRIFLREGDLVKRCNRSGRNIKYRFFLFSDLLIYSHKSASMGDYKIHEELPLHLMKLTDIAGHVGDVPHSGGNDYGDNTNKVMRSFQIHHPRKSFLAFAPSVESKKSWMSDIQSAIERDVECKARLEGARLASASAER